VSRLPTRRDHSENLALQLGAVRDRREVHGPLRPSDPFWILDAGTARRPLDSSTNAEQAAAAGNYSAAEALLREALALQEQTLGPHHPDFAGTLNNLGVICEMTDNPIDAEHYFRPRLHHRDREPDAGPSVRRHESQDPSRFRRGPRTARGVAAVSTGGRSLAGGARASCSSTARVVPVCEAGRDADSSEEIPAPARAWRVERACPADRSSHDGPALGIWGRGDQVASGDRDSSSA